MKRERCPGQSYTVGQCDQEAGHSGICSNAGDGFHAHNLPSPSLRQLLKEQELLIGYRASLRALLLNAPHEAYRQDVLAALAKSEEHTRELAARIAPLLEKEESR